MPITERELRLAYGGKQKARNRMNAAVKRDNRRISKFHHVLVVQEKLMNLPMNEWPTFRPGESK